MKMSEINALDFTATRGQAELPPMNRYKTNHQFLKRQKHTK